MSVENVNKLLDLDLIRPIQWDSYKDSNEQYVNRFGCNLALNYRN